MVQNKPIPGMNPEDPKHLRLTLRTLLAYMDDVLEPAQAREIGTKIQETPYASQLVDRIQDVLRRRRVAAPDLTGPGSGLDPNVVAEYLDNTLLPESVPDVERVCLESDAHLAEVAACHQILTLVLGDPIHVSAESRERLHALIPAALAHQPAAARALAPAARTSAPAPTAPAAQAPAVARPAREPVSASTNGGTVAKTRFSETIPEYLKPKPLWKRALVPTVVVLVFMFWLALLIYDPSILGGSGKPDEVAQSDQPPSAKTESQQLPVKTQEPEPVESAAKTEIPDEPMEAGPAKAASAEVAVAETNVPPIVIDPMPPKDKEPVEVVVNKAGTSTTEAGPVDESEKVGTTEPAKTQEPETTTTTQPVVPAPPAAEYTTRAANSITTGVLLRFDEKKNEWGTLPYRSIVRIGEQLACPEPLDAVFAMNDTDCEVTFIGGVLASFENASAPAAFALDVRQGKILFTRTEGDNQSLAFTVLIGNDTLQFELVEPNTRCGLEILPRLPDQFEQSPGPNWYTGRLYVDAGQVRFTDRTGAKHLLAGKQALDVSPNEPAEGQPAPIPPMVEMDQFMPEWLNPLNRGYTSQTSRYMRQIHSAFQEADGKTDVTTVLLPLAKSDNTPPAVAVMAAKSLAMIGSLRDVADLLSLNEASPEEIRMATIEGIRRWLTLHPDPAYGQLLRNELGRNFRKDTAAQVYRLLWGYRKSELKDTAAALSLVDLLMDDSITVRTLAFVHLQELTGKTNNYRPLDSESQRKTAVNRWRNDVLEGKLFN